MALENFDTEKGDLMHSIGREGVSNAAEIGFRKATKQKKLKLLSIKTLAGFATVVLLPSSLGELQLPFRTGLTILNSQGCASAMTLASLACHDHPFALL